MTVASPYPELDSPENCYAEWRCRPVDVVAPIMSARSEIINAGGGLASGELKKLAREAAAEVRMRLEE